MFLSRMFNSLTISLQEKVVGELLEMNQKTKEYGLVLTPDEIQHMIAARNKVLQDYGRLELGIEVTKKLMEFFALPLISMKRITHPRLMNCTRSFII